jgi:hypothetical protein
MKWPWQSDEPSERPHDRFFDNVTESLRLGQTSTPTGYGIESEIPMPVRRWFEANGFEVLTAVMGNSFVRWPKNMSETKPHLFIR